MRFSVPSESVSTRIMFSRVRVFRKRWTRPIDQFQAFARKRSECLSWPISRFGRGRQAASEISQSQAARRQYGSSPKTSFSCQPRSMR